MFYDLLDPNLEVTSAGKPDACLDVLDDEGNAVPGLFMVTSSEVRQPSNDMCCSAVGGISSGMLFF